MSMVFARLPNCARALGPRPGDPGGFIPGRWERVRPVRPEVLSGPAVFARGVELSGVRTRPNGILRGEVQRPGPCISRQSIVMKAFGWTILVLALAAVPTRGEE